MPEDRAARTTAGAAPCFARSRLRAAVASQNNVRPFTRTVCHFGARALVTSPERGRGTPVLSASERGGSCARARFTVQLVANCHNRVTFGTRKRVRLAEPPRARTRARSLARSLSRVDGNTHQRHGRANRIAERHDPSAVLHSHSLSTRRTRAHWFANLLHAGKVGQAHIQARHLLGL